MDDLANHERAVELLQQLGLKEYEAKSFVALARLPQGTAKDISETTEVPRTRVYDAIRVLESKGLVEIQHSSPQQFRAVSIDEAVETLRNEYEERADSLRQTLEGLEPATTVEETEVAHEVWALSSEAGIASRTEQVIGDADEEIVLVIGHESAFTETVAESLEEARERGVDVVIGTVSEALGQEVRDSLPETEVFVSGLEWLSQSTLAGDDTEISQLLLIDRETILVSTFHEITDDGQEDAQAVFGHGFDNGLVAIVRRILATGMLSKTDPGAENH
jgi:sugar-specific transcriptional regulator TrmB